MVSIIGESIQTQSINHLLLRSISLEDVVEMVLVVFSATASAAIFTEGIPLASRCILLRMGALAMLERAIGRAGTHAAREVEEAEREFAFIIISDTDIYKQI